MAASRASKLCSDVLRSYGLGSGKLHGNRSLRLFDHGATSFSGSSTLVSSTYGDLITKNTNFPQNYGELSEFRFRTWLHSSKLGIVDIGRRYYLRMLAFIGRLVCFSSVAVTAAYLYSLETIPYSKRTHLVLMPRVVEKMIGELRFEAYKKRNKNKILPSTDPMSVRATLIAERLFRALERDLRQDKVWGDLSYGLRWLKKHLADRRAARYLKNIEWEVIVVKSPDINACCFPGGKIVLHTATLECFESDDEIACYIGHEAGHVLGRHRAERISKDMGFTDLALLAYNFDVSVVARKMLTRPISLYLYREMELEADYIGLLLMSSAGYHPRGALNVKKAALKRWGNRTPPRSGHPYRKTRVDLVAKAQEEAMTFYRESLSNADQK